MSPDTLPDPKTGKQMPVDDRWTEPELVTCVDCGRNVQNVSMTILQADGGGQWAGLDCPSCGKLAWVKMS